MYRHDLRPCQDGSLDRTTAWCRTSELSRETKQFFPGNGPCFVLESGSKLAKEQVLVEMLLRVKVMADALALVYAAVEADQGEAAREAIIKLAKAEAEFDELGARLTEKRI